MEERHADLPFLFRETRKEDLATNRHEEDMNKTFHLRVPIRANSWRKFFMFCLLSLVLEKCPTAVGDVSLDVRMLRIDPDTRCGMAGFDLN
jgi:hypothetical protein